YPLLLITKTLRNLASPKWFIKLNIVAAFYNIRIAPGYKGKTAFRTRFNLFKYFDYLVIPFRLTNTLASF
ncbi:hypothetical protein ACRALDRAFT_2103453, partial [Sodiomyces alcalophilus JCM 7366]|uniref:uncharacterized protein n=1 Tax=Sodiomyces alcalophilus JCM 7366 TaxID=591952 RepID=UPI0039B3D18A